MPERLEIVVVDKGGTAGPASPAAPATPARPTSARTQIPPPAAPAPPTPPTMPPAPRVQPPPAPVRPPPVQTPPPSDEDLAARSLGISGAVFAGRFGAAARAAGISGLGIAGAAGPVGLALGVAATGLTQAFKAAAAGVREFTAVMQTEVQRLAGFSPAVALAAAQTDIGRELGDLRRAQRIGPRLANFERTRAEFEGKLADIMTEILNQLLRIFELLEPLTKPILAAMEALLKFLEKHEELIAVGFKAIIAANFPLWLPDVLEKIGLIEQNTKKPEDEAGFFMNQLLSQLQDPEFWPADQPLPGEPARVGA